MSNRSTARGLGKRIERLRSVVHFMPQSRDKTDLLYFLGRVEKAEVCIKKTHYKLRYARRKLKAKEAEINQLSGALNLSRYYLEKANEKIHHQKLIIQWLTMKTMRSVKLPVEDKAKISDLRMRLETEGVLYERENLL